MSSTCTAQPPIETLEQFLDEVGRQFPPPLLDRFLRGCGDAGGLLRIPALALMLKYPEVIVAAAVGLGVLAVLFPEDAKRMGRECRSAAASLAKTQEELLPFLGAYVKVLGVRASAASAARARFKPVAAA